MSAGFTPGPWAIRRGHSVVEIRTVAGLEIAATTGGHYWQNFSDEALANASLIAAAPELFNAATLALQTLAPWKDDDFVWATMSQLHAALAKATPTGDSA